MERAAVLIVPLGGLLLCALLLFGVVLVRRANKDSKLVFDSANVVSTSVAPDGTVTQKDAQGNTKTSKPGGDTKITDKDGKETFSALDMAKKMLTDPFTYEALAAGMAYEALVHADSIAKKIQSVIKNRAEKTLAKQLEKASERTSTKAGEKAAEKAAEKTAERAAEKALEKGLEKGGEKIAEKAAVKAATRVTTTAAVAGSTGPAAPFVEVAEMVFQMTLGVMDELNLGGFKNMTNMSALNSMRDTINESTEKAFEDLGLTWPIFVGPIDKIDSNVYVEQLKTIIGVKYTNAIKTIQDEWKSGARPKLPPGSASKDFEEYFNKNIDADKFSAEAEAEICTKNGGVMKPHPKTKEMHCTWETATPTTCQSPWPVKNGGTYYEFDQKLKVCRVAPSMMREKCEGLGLGCTYNFDTGSCNLTRQYCGRYGADEGLVNGDCKISKGEQIAELIFGTSFVRSIVNIFGESSYEPCPPGSHKANEIGGLVAGACGLATAASAGLAAAGCAVGAASAFQMLCSQDKCKDDEDKVAGLCYKKCKKATDKEKADGWPDYDQSSDSLGSKTQGMCYRCPPKYKKSSAGLCQILDPKTDIGVPAKCPDGWTTTVQGPGGMCEPGCSDEGFKKKIGGICYSDKVQGGLLVKGPKKGPCPPGDRDDGTSCWAKTGHIGICSISCTDVYGRISKNLFQRQSCEEGYTLKAAMCYAVSRPLKPAKPLREVGVCKQTDREKVEGMCFKKCEKPFTRLKGTGTCRVEGLPTIPADQYTRKVEGISYKVFPRKRIAPFPSTSESDFKNSVLGRQIQAGINGIRDGDPKAVGKAIAASAIVANPAVLVLGAGDLANIGVEKMGLGPKEKRQEGTGGE